VHAAFKTEDGFPLGSWVAKQRGGYKLGRLTQEQIDDLDGLDFIWDPVDGDYMRGLVRLKAYREDYGDCRVQTHFKTGDGFALGRWVSGRRTAYREGRLSEERINELNELGFIWDSLQDAFELGLVRLQKYKDVHGNCRVPLKFRTEEGLPLGKWVSSRRQDRIKGRLSRDRIAELNELGFIWDLKKK
jgi:hypothetical protein